MAENLAYHDEQDIKNIEKIRNLQKKLPDFTKDFIRGIEQRTSTRTRLGYVYDLIVFFEYLQQETDYFKNVDYKSAPVTILDEITVSTLEDYLSYLQTYQKSSTKKATSFSEIQDKDITIQRRNKASGIKRKLSAIKSFYRYYYRKEMIHNNPTELVDMPKLEKKPIIRMEANEVAELLDHVENGEQLSARQLAFHEKTEIRDFAMISLMLGTGIRVSECVGLNLDDLDLEETCAKVYRKGGKESVVYFSDEVRAALLPYLEQRKSMQPDKGHEEALFLSLKNRRISVRAVENMVKKYTRTVTTVKKITPHKLRSTFGTALYQETNDIYLVATVLGHSDVNTTKTHYADIETEQKRSARNAVKLRES